MTKQVTAAALVEQAAAFNPLANDERNLFVQVKTTDQAGKQIGTRIVDLYHFGTRNWLHNHHWWAMHNGHSIITEVASTADVDKYLVDAKQKLADKFNAA